MSNERGQLSDGELLHTTIDPDAGSSEYAFCQLIADIEGVDVETLPPLYDEVDHFVETLFRDPPSKQAQVELTFSYYGYRVRLDQSGHVTLLRVTESAQR